MRTLCHFLDVFASGDALLRARASSHGDQLRRAGFAGDEIIASAATALLVALEQEIDQRTQVLSKLPLIWRDDPTLPARQPAGAVTSP